MEEIRNEDAFGNIGFASGLSLLQETMEKSITKGVQIGVPWSKAVYEYLSESTTAEDLENIFELSTISSFVDLEIKR